jgi:hypothetical protein
MTISATTFNFSAALVLAALAFAPQISGTAQAGVTSDLMNCKYNSRQKTVSCCEYSFKVNTRPLWLQGSNGSCSTMVKCVGSKGKYSRTANTAKTKCYVQLPTRYNPNSDGGRGSPSEKPKDNGSNRITVSDSVGPKFR